MKHQFILVVIKRIPLEFLYSIIEVLSWLWTRQHGVYNCRNAPVAGGAAINRVSRTECGRINGVQGLSEVARLASEMRRVLK